MKRNLTNKITLALSGVILTMGAFAFFSSAKSNDSAHVIEATGADKYSRINSLDELTDNSKIILVGEHSAGQLAVMTSTRNSTNSSKKGYHEYKGSSDIASATTISAPQDAMVFTLEKATTNASEYKYRLKIAENKYLTVKLFSSIDNRFPLLTEENNKNVNWTINLNETNKTTTITSSSVNGKTQKLCYYNSNNVFNAFKNDDTTYIYKYVDPSAAVVPMTGINASLTRLYATSSTPVKMNVVAKDGTEQMGDVNYVSSDPTIATIDNSGNITLATPFKAGDVKFTATRAKNSAHTASVILHVVDKLTVDMLYNDFVGVEYTLTGKLIATDGPDGILYDGHNTCLTRMANNKETINSSYLNHNVTIKGTIDEFHGKTQFKIATPSDVVDNGASELVLNPLNAHEVTPEELAHQLGHPIQGVFKIDPAADQDTSNKKDQELKGSALMNGSDEVPLILRAKSDSILPKFIASFKKEASYPKDRSVYLDVLGRVDYFDGYQLSLEDANDVSIAIYNPTTKELLPNSPLASFLDSLKFEGPDAISVDNKGVTEACATNYAAAKALYNNLCDAERGALKELTSLKKYVDRYDAWKVANNDASVNASANSLLNDNGEMITIIMASIILVLALGCGVFVIQRKRREE